MAAPEHVPVDRTKPVRAYESPPRRADSWLPDRPGELVAGGQPHGDRFGHQGPDQGYALSLARRLEGKLTLTTGEHEKDALAGAVAVGLKRASIFGRAPVLDDLKVGLTVWGFLGEAAKELVDVRKHLFEEVSNPHHYAELRNIVDLVPEDTLRLSLAEVEQLQRTDWHRLLGDLPAAAH
jgi:hypothetical protein